MRFTVLRISALRAGRSGALWGLVFGSVIAASAVGYASTFPDPHAREVLARSFGSNAGIAALLGPARHLEMVGGFAAWRAGGILGIIGAIWGLLAATRVLRGEEEAGRWELLLAGPTTRGAATTQAVGGLGVGLAALWAVTAGFTMAAGASPDVGFTVTASLFLAAAVVCDAAVFTAVGALTSQLAGSRRQANGIGAAFLGVAYLLRMVADSAPNLGWLRWTTPLGWAEELRPMVGSNPAPLLLVVAFSAVTVTTAARLAHRRDLGASALPSPDTASPRIRLLTGSTGLSVRLLRGTSLAWIGAMAAMGLVMGIVAQSASTVVTGSATIERMLSRLGGRQGGAAAYIGFAFVFTGALVAFAAASQIGAARTEEADGRLDNLLVRPVSRTRWLGGRLLVAVVVVVASSALGGVAAWLGAASQDTHIAFGDLLEAGINVAPPGIFVLGVGAFMLGVRPRLAPTAAYAIVTWSFLVQLVATFITSNRWLFDSSLFHHIAPAPAAPPDWTSALWLTALGLAGVAAGLVTFGRRDLISA